jgi:hypothetical protein
MASADVSFRVFKYFTKHHHYKENGFQKRGNLIHEFIDSVIAKQNSGIPQYMILPKEIFTACFSA